MYHSGNSTGVDPVQVETDRHGGAHVWLRINITHRTDEDGESWEYDETYGHVAPPPTVAEIEDDFDAWWLKLEEMHTTDTERIDEVRDTAATNGDAIVELAEMVADGEVTMEDLAQAIVELAEIVGGGE